MVVECTCGRRLYVWWYNVRVVVDRKYNYELSDKVVTLWHKPCAKLIVKEILVAQEQSSNYYHTCISFTIV